MCNFSTIYLLRVYYVISLFFFALMAIFRLDFEYCVFKFINFITSISVYL